MEDFKLGSWLVGGGSSKLRSFSLSKSYSRISWVYTCVRAIASSIGGVPLLFTRGDETITDPDDPVLTLFNRPNPPTIPSFRELLLRTFTLLGIEGMLYWVFERKKGVWTRIEIKRKWQMRPVFKSGSDSELLGWVEVDKYRRQKTAYGLTEVLPISYYNPDDPFGGLAPLTAARLGIEQEYSMAAWNAAFFAQGLRNPIGIEFKRALLPKQRKELEKSIRDYFSGIDGGQGVFMLEGDGKFCDLHLSAAKDLDFVEGKQLTREEICAVYGVPPAIVGIFRYASYANSNVQRKLFWENCLLPKMDALLDLIRMGILEQEFTGVGASWDKRGIVALQKEFKSLAAAAKTYFDMGYTRQETAFILDAPELDPPAPELEDEDEPDPNDGPVDILPVITDQILTNQILNPCKTNLDIITNKADDQWFRDYGIAYEQVLMSLEFRWLDYLHRYFDNLGNALYRRITRGDLAVLNPVVWAESWEGMAELLFRDTCELAAKITIAELNTSGNLDLIMHIIRNTSAKTSVVDSIDISKFFTTDEMTAFNHAISSYASKTVGVSNDIIGALNRRATQELLGGMTPNQLRKAVSRIVDETYRGRSLTIARTLSGGAYNSARYSSFETLGVQLHKWINSGDPLVRDTHRQEAGSAPVVLGTPFPITGCRYPLDPMGKAKEVINCCCTTFPVKHKAPRRVRPVTIPREPATAPMVRLGREKVLSNFRAKLKIYEDLIQPDKCNSISHTTMSRLEDLADSVLDGDMFKAAQYSSKEIDDIVKKYGKKIKINLPGMTKRGENELRKILLAGVKKDLLKSDSFQDVRIGMDKTRKGVNGWYTRSKKSVSLSEKSAIGVTKFCEALAKGNAPSAQTLASMQTVMHEFGHHLQDWTPALTNWANLFFRNRTRGEALRTWRGNKKVKVFKDKWADSYQGRWYGWEKPRQAGTEVVSMYNELASFLPWTEGMVNTLKQSSFRRAWARGVLSKILADPDGLTIMLQLVKGL